MRQCRRWVAVLALRGSGLTVGCGDPDTGVVDITFIGDNGTTLDAWSLQL